MHIGWQIEAPEGLGSLEKGIRYYYAGRTSDAQVLLVWFYLSKCRRWRAGCIHINSMLFEKELTASPARLQACKKQNGFPTATESVSGINFEVLKGERKGKSVFQQVMARVEAIEDLLEVEGNILSSDEPLKLIAKLGREHGSRVHQYDLQYWFFVYVLHGRNKWALTPATHQNGTWDRCQHKHADKKLGRPSLIGARKGWPSAPMQDQIFKAYLSGCGLGKTMRQIYLRALTETFGCQIIREEGAVRKLIHPKNAPFPTYGQFRWVVNTRLGQDNVQKTKYGASRQRRTAVVDQGNTTGEFANLLERIEVDAYRCNERPASRESETMPELVVARAICVTSGARVGIGFSLGGESQETYRSMLWSMAVPKELVAEAYGIPLEHLDWPMRGMSRAFLSDRGPAGQESLIAEMERSIPVKSLTPSYAPKSKPNVESSNPRSFDPEGAPSFVQSELQVGSFMRQEVLRAASENRSLSIIDRLSPEMLRDFHRLGLTATPQALWTYLEERMRTCSQMIDTDMAVRAFLKRRTVNVDKVGVEFNGIHYNSSSLKESGLHEKLVRRGISTLTGYTLSLVGRLIWVEVEGRLFKLMHMRRLRHDEEELFISGSQLENLARLKRELSARTRESGEAARAEFVNSASILNGHAPDSGRRVAGKPGRGKGAALLEAQVLKAKEGKKAA